MNQDFVVLDPIKINPEMLCYLSNKDKSIMSKYKGQTKKDFLSYIRSNILKNNSANHTGVLPAQEHGGDAVSFYVEHCMLKESGSSLEEMYSLNSLGYRSDQFFRHEKDTDQRHILFAGCSFTFGQGLYLDSTWPKIIYDRISKDQEVSGFFNLGTPGVTNLQIVRLVYEYIKEFGVPGTVFILLPDVIRDIRASEIAPHSIGDIVGTQVNLLTDLLIAYGAKVVVSSWWNHDDYEHKNNVKVSPPNINDLLCIKNNERQSFIDNFKETAPAFLQYRAYDLAHPGIAEHAYYAEVMYNGYHDK